MKDPASITLKLRPQPLLFIAGWIAAISTIGLAAYAGVDSESFLPVIAVLFGFGMICIPLIPSMFTRSLTFTNKELVVNDRVLLSQPMRLSRSEVQRLEVDHWQSADSVLFANGFGAYGRLILRLDQPLYLPLRKNLWLFKLFDRYIQTVSRSRDYSSLAVPTLRKQLVRIIAEAQRFDYPVAIGPDATKHAMRPLPTEFSDLPRI